MFYKIMAQLDIFYFLCCQSGVWFAAALHFLISYSPLIWNIIYKLSNTLQSRSFFRSPTPTRHQLSLDSSSSILCSITNFNQSLVARYGSIKACVNYTPLQTVPSFILHNFYSFLILFVHLIFR